ncbi:MAG: hypothetical protein IKD44_06405 [Lentisphaeria bacterium]|nr:hypothetical protein [Lentisphaeria bacterium]
MLGIKSSGCFIIGIITGFILALVLGIVCVCFFNPTFKEKTLTHVEIIWKKIKNNVDDSLDAAKNAATHEPEIPGQKSVPAVTNDPTAPQHSPASPAPAAPKPRIEIKLNI